MLNYSILDNKGIINSKVFGESMYNLLDQTFQIPINNYHYQIFKVTNEYIARPDLISYDAYGTTNYADIICKLNGISNPFELNEGNLLIIPAIEDINSESFVFPAPREEAEINDDEINDLPKPKHKNEKRKSNEAIIGDSRFRINPSAGIIIY